MRASSSSSFASGRPAIIPSRMAHELRLLSSSPMPGISAWPRQHSSVFIIDAIIDGPPDTPYCSGSFKLEVKISARYPFEPPEVRFITPVYHCNIFQDSAGRICLDTLKMPPKGAWTPSLNISTVLSSVALLLATPNPEDGLVPDITDQCLRDRKAYENTARQWTQRFAISDDGDQKSLCQTSPKLISPILPCQFVDDSVNSSSSEDAIHAQKMRKRQRSQSQVVTIRWLAMMQGKPPLNLNATAVPYWANNVFKYLSIVVKKKELKLDRYTEEVAGCLDRIRILSSHIANVQTEISRTQNLLDAKSKCIESEDHLKRLSECELSRLRTDGITVEKEVSDTNEIIHSMQNEMFAAKEKIDKFMVQKNWNEEELEQWSLAVKQSEDDAIALSRYCRNDDVILKSGTMKIGHLTKDLHVKRQQLDLEVTETLSAQIELDKTSKEFENVHMERQNIVRQWEEIQNILFRRDGEICNKTMEVQKLKKAITQREIELADSGVMLDQERANNEAMNLSIKSIERICEKSKVKLQEYQTSLQIIAMDHETKIRESSDAITMLRKEQQMLKSSKKMQMEALGELDQAEKRREVSERRLCEEVSRAEGIENRAQHMITVYENSRSTCERNDKLLQSLIQIMFKKNQQLFKHRRLQANTIADINGAKVALKNVQTQISELDQQLINQQETLYSIDFLLQQLEKKVSRASGKRTFTEKDELNMKIVRFLEELDFERRQKRLLAVQVNKIVLDVQRCQTKVISTTNELEELNTTMSDYLRDNKSAELELKELEATKNELILQADMLRLEARRLESSLAAEVSQVYALENRSNQLRIADEERERLLNMDQETVRAETRLLDNGRHQLVIEAKEREQRVEILRRKYDMVAGRLNGDEGTQHTQAFYIIQAAQKKEELNRAGDLLNAAIKAETRNLRVLDATRNDLKDRNVDCRMSSQKADLAGPEVTQQRKLTDQLRFTTNFLRVRKARCQEVNRYIDERKVVIAALLVDVHNVQALFQQANQEDSEVNADVNCLKRRVEQTIEYIVSLVSTLQAPTPTRVSVILLHLKCSVIDAITGFFASPKEGTCLSDFFYDNNGATLSFAPF